MIKSSKIIKDINNWNNIWDLNYPDDVDISKETFWIGKIKQVHHINFLLWIKENKIRDTKIEAYEIACLKKSIDALNMKRASIIEMIDSYLMSSLKLSIVKDWSNLYINSQTLGKIIDRISIFCLKHYYTKKHMENINITPNLKNKYEENLKILEEQIQYMCTCFDRFYHQLRIGKGYMMPYSQFKMYG